LRIPFFPQAIYEKSLTRMFVEKGIFSKEDFLEMVKVIDEEMKIQRKELLLNG